MLFQCFVGLMLCFFTLIVHAEIITDGKLGGKLGVMQTLPGPDFKITAKLGEQVGTNLFHSFQQFNLQPNEIATFSGPENVHNIISRVTGGDESIINGTIQSTIQGAHLYFINPDGFSFGEHAKLDISGSFYVSTADYLEFVDGSQFNATHPENSLLTSASPIAFGFLGENPAASVTLQDVNDALAVTDTHTLAIVAGHIGIYGTKLYAPGGTIQLTSVNNAGKVNISPETVTDVLPLSGGKIDLSQATIGDNAQSIYIRSGQLVVEDSTVNARAQNGGKPTYIEVTSAQVELKQDAWFDTRSINIINAGHIIFHTDELIMAGNATIDSSTQGEGGSAGTIKIQARQKLEMTGESEIITNTLTGNGMGGGISLEVGKLNMAGTTRIAARNSAGLIEIAAKRIELRDNATIETITTETAIGGNITIAADSLEMRGRAWLISSSFGTGNSGNINLGQGMDALRLFDQSGIISGTFAQGQGGTIKAQVSNQLAVGEDAVISVGTAGQGTGGHIQLTLPANEDSVKSLESISAGNLENNPVIQEVSRMLGQARQVGVKVDDDILAGGGKSGTVHIQFGTLTVDGTIGFAKQKIELARCPLEEDSFFKIQFREGLAGVF